MDFIALVIAFAGAFVVYNIFKEQQVRLVSGQKGVRVLESLLLEEINKQYARDLALKEQELQDVRQRLAEIESEYQIKLAQIGTDAQQELERQIILIQREITAQLVGKTDTEQQEIRRQYEERLINIKNAITQERLEREALERERYQQIQIQEEQNLNQEQLRLQLEEAQQRLQDSQLQLTQLQTIQAGEQNYNAIDQQFDQSITSLLLSTQIAITNNQHDQAKTSLNRIKILYRNSPELFPQQRKEADLYVVEMLLSYLDSLEQVSNLQQINIDQQNSLAQIRGLQDGEMGLKKEELQYFINTITNKDQHALALRQIQDLNRDIPELLAFAEYYITFIRQDPNLDSMIAQGDNLVNSKRYQEAINTYQQILQTYSINDKAREIVQKLYSTILLELQNKNILVNSSIPQKMQTDIQQLLSNSRYSEVSHQIIYLKEPDGYIADIIDKDTVLVLLLPQKRVTPRQVIEVYRIVNQDNFHMNKIGTLRSQKREQRMFQITLLNHNMKLGDLVYIK
ncbi:MAG: hypothetical protein ACRCWI_00335 [Brevinema sp.]